MIVSDLGWSISTSQELNQKQSFPGGMHGYDSDYEEMHGIFFASGPSFNKGKRVDSFENINIYPLICHTLDLLPYEPNEYWDENLFNKGYILK